MGDVNSVCLDLQYLQIRGLKRKRNVLKIWPFYIHSGRFIRKRGKETGECFTLKCFCSNAIIVLDGKGLKMYTPNAMIYLTWPDSRGLLGTQTALTLTSESRQFWISDSQGGVTAPSLSNEVMLIYRIQDFIHGTEWVTMKERHIYFLKKLDY